MEHCHSDQSHIMHMHCLLQNNFSNPGEIVQVLEALNCCGRSYCKNCASPRSETEEPHSRRFLLPKPDTVATSQLVTTTLDIRSNSRRGSLTFAGKARQKHQCIRTEHKTGEETARNDARVFLGKLG